MRWPFNRRVDPVHAWGTLTVAVGVAGVIATELATLHASQADFRWWWPTNWMIIPLVIFVGGIALLVVPVRRSPRAPAVTAEPPPAVTVARAPAPVPTVTDMSPQRRRAILAAATAGAKAGRIEALRRLHGDGRQLRARAGEVGEREASLPSALFGDIARWEATVDANFTGAPSIRDRFAEAPREDPFAVTAGGAHDRISYQLELLEMIIRDLEERR